MIYVDFQSILVPENNGKQNQDQIPKPCSLQLYM